MWDQSLLPHVVVLDFFDSTCGSCHIFTLCNNRICFISQSHTSWNEVMRGTSHKNVIEVTLTAIKRIKRHFRACCSSLQKSHRAELEASSSATTSSSPTVKTTPAQRDRKCTWNSSARVTFQFSSQIPSQHLAHMRCPKKHTAGTTSCTKIRAWHYKLETISRLLVDRRTVHRAPLVSDVF